MYRNLSRFADLTSLAANMDLTDSKFSFYLKELARFNLIKIERNKIEVTNSGYLDLMKSPRLARLLEDKWVPWFFGRVRSHAVDKKYFLKMGSTGLNKENQLQLKREFLQLWEKYKEIGLRNQSLGSNEFEPFAFCIGMGPHRVGLFENHNGRQSELPRSKID